MKTGSFCVWPQRQAHQAKVCPSIQAVLMTKTYWKCSGGGIAGTSG
eukprot:CAMPEP_0203913086 /NCGR_PEP_ID=MMETSP0359-20131031/54105_1 /ASSEMBLY_ACC=CAM_ASM_000338 /TAXON_ID=268821 /ORGANISM="Scrippsiella Hangoei, Strain SHTV-5" /LENGTH=45 /DNA_ID= /DNA_START= /DNA_END= /DNA_ORIENTATION=